jgi:hypothetical protein
MKTAATPSSRTTAPVPATTMVCSQIGYTPEIVADPRRPGARPSYRTVTVWPVL